MHLIEKKVSSETLYRGRIVNVRSDMAELPNGKLSPREVVEHPGGVTVLPIDGAGRVIFVRQFRYPFLTETLEIPAGKLEPGEDHYSAGIRELHEETGYTSADYGLLAEIWPSPGFCDERLFIYWARDLTAGKSCPDEDEFLSVEPVPFEEAVEMVMRNEIPDAKTAVAILMGWKKFGNV